MNDTGDGPFRYRSHAITVGHMAQHPFTDLSPTDAAVTFRSFGRRFRSAVGLDSSPPDEANQSDREEDELEVDLEEMANRVGSEGRSALDHVALAASRMELATSEVQAALVTDSHQVDQSLAEVAVVHVPSHSGHLEPELERLTKAAEALAHTIEHSDSSWWLKTRTTTTGATATPLALVQATVAFVLDRMHAIRAVLHEVRRRPSH